jgi:hypothetical protein
MRLRLAVPLAAAVSAIAGAHGAPTAGQADRTPDALLAAYAAGDVAVIERAIRTEDEFEQLRKAIGFVKDGQFRGAMRAWHLARRPAQAAFLFDVARVALNKNWRLWLDVLVEAGNFVRGRPDMPGVSPADDAFEILFHKTAVAMLMGQRRPDFVELHGLDPLATRLVSEPPADGVPRLVDPWIDLARAIVADQWTLIDPTRLERLSTNLIYRFDQAARFDVTRAEALVRKAWLFVRLGRHDDAVATLDRVGADGRSVELSVRYWARLFRGKAFEGLGRIAEAASVYEAARALVPRAQSAGVALVALELRRGQHARAYEWAADVRTAPDTAFDPWWQYLYAEFRHFDARLEALRRTAIR